MNSTATLPEGYREILSVDLQKNKKLAILVNILAFTYHRGGYDYSRGGICALRF